MVKLLQGQIQDIDMDILIPREKRLFLCNLILLETSRMVWQLLANIKVL